MTDREKIKKLKKTVRELRKKNNTMYHQMTVIGWALVALGYHNLGRKTVEDAKAGWK